MCRNVLRFSFIMSGNVPLSMQCVFADDADCIAVVVVVVVVHAGISFRAALIFVSGIYRVLLPLCHPPPLHSRRPRIFRELEI